MLVASGVLLFALSCVLVTALSRAASETHDGWRLDERIPVDLHR